MKDRIETTYEAIDEMIKFHGQPKPKDFGLGVWDATKEFNIYKEQVGTRYTELQWSIIESYFKQEFKKLVSFRKSS